MFFTSSSKLEMKGEMDVALHEDKKVREAARYLWVLADETKGGRRLVNPQKILDALEFSPVIGNRLIKSGLITHDKNGAPDSYLLPKSRFDNWRLIPPPDQEVQLKQIVDYSLALKRKNQLDLPNVAIPTDVSPGLIQSRRKSVLIVDWDNISIRLSERGKDFSPMEAINLARPLGDLAAAYVFIDSGSLDYIKRVNLSVNGFEIVDCPRLAFSSGSKDMVDPNIMRKIFWLMRYCPEINTYIIASADHDFLTMVTLLKDHQKEVYLMSAMENAQSMLSHQADGVLYLSATTGGELEMISEQFAQDNFEFATDSLQYMVETLALCVRILAIEAKINQNIYRFQDLVNILYKHSKFPSDRYNVRILRAMLNFLRDQGVIKKISHGVTRITHYRVNERHEFYDWMINYKQK